MLSPGRPLVRLSLLVLALLGSAFGAGAQTCEPPIPAPQINAPPQVCPYAPADASVLPPAEGTWQTVSWAIQNGSFVDANGNTMEYANGENIRFIGNGYGPVTLSAWGQDSFGCNSPEGTAQVSIRTIAAPQLSVPPQVCPYAPAIASVLPPAEGTWQTVSWAIQNGSFVDANGNTIPYANGESILFVGNGYGPVTLSAWAQDSFGCNTPEGTAQVPIRTIAAPQLSVPPQVCPYTPASASVLPPAEGTWQTVSWAIGNGSFVDANGNTIPYANGEEIRFIGNGYGPVTLSAWAQDSFGCNSPEGTAQVPIRTIAAPQLSVPPPVCPYTPAIASVLPPAEGTWQTVSWAIQNGSFVDANGNTILFANGEEIRFVGNGYGPVTLSAWAQDSFGCNSPEGMAQVPIRTIAAPQLSVPPQVCPYTPAIASVLPPAEGTWQTVSWAIQNGSFVDANGNTILFANGEEIRFVANGSDPVTLSAWAQDSSGCNSPEGMAQVPIRTIPAPQIIAPAQVCWGSPAIASVLPPEEGTWQTVSWSILNGSFVDGSGNTIPYANGEEIRFVAHGTEPVTLFAYAQDSFGCPAPEGTITIQTVVGGGETPSITLSSPDICGTEPVTASVLDVFTSYSWTVVNGAITSGDGTHEITFVADGIGPVTVSVETNSASCPMTDSETLPLTGLPAYLFAPPSACVGAVLKARAASFYSDFSWTATNATIEGPADAEEVAFRATGTGPVILSFLGIDGNGCFTRNSVTVPTDGYPTPQIGFPQGESMCPGGTAAAQADPWYPTYNWTITNAINVTGQGTPVVNFEHVPGAGDVGITLSVGEGECSAYAARTLPVRTTQPLAAELAAPGVCANGNGTLYIDNYDSYSHVSLYATNGTITGNGPGRVPGGRAITFSNNGSGDTAILVQADSNACLVAEQFTATMLAAPGAAVSGTAAVCAGGSATIQAGLTGTGPWNITWSDGLTQTGITASPAMRLVSPSATTTYTVVAVSDANCAGTASGSATVTVNPNPAVDINVHQVYDSPGSGTIVSNANDVVEVCGDPTIRLVPTVLAPANTYSWSTGATTALIDIRESGTYTLTMTDAAGCTATSSVTVNYNALPATPAITPGGPTTFCEGGSVTLSAPAGFSYLWSTGATTQSIAVSVSGSYSVTVTNANGCSGTSAATDVTVNANPETPVVTPSGPTTFCEGGSVTLTAPAGFSYQWSNGATTQSIVVSASGSYSVTVTNASGCSATSAATDVTVSANPETPVVTPSGPTTFCEGGSVTLSAPAGFSYQWSTGATSQSIVVNASGSYSVTVTNASGCSATSAATDVTVNAGPATPVITPSGPTTFCEGGSVTLSAPAGFSYQWSNGATSQSIVVSASGSYSVTVTTASGCSATSAATDVTVNAGPATPAITPGGPTTFCEGGSVTLSAPAGFSYQWSNGATTQSIMVSASGSYSVTVTNASGCSATSAATDVTVNANPSTPVITPSGPTTFCEGGSVTLTAPASASYLWSTGATTQSIVVSASGSYSVTVANANGCSATSAATAVTVNPLPAVPVITPSGSTNLCPGQSVTLTAPAGFSYQWSNGATTQAITVSTPGSYSVTVTNANGCQRTSAPVTVAANPPTVITTHPLSQSMPRNSTRVLSVVATGTAALQYQWYTGTSGDTSSPIAGATGSTYTIGPFNKKGTYRYWVRVTSTGCPGSSANSNTATITVTN